MYSTLNAKANDTARVLWDGLQPAILEDRRAYWQRLMAQCNHALLWDRSEFVHVNYNERRVYFRQYKRSLVLSKGGKSNPSTNKKFRDDAFGTARGATPLLFEHRLNLEPPARWPLIHEVAAVLAQSYDQATLPPDCDDDEMAEDGSPVHPRKRRRSLLETKRAHKAILTRPEALEVIARGEPINASG